MLISKKTNLKSLKFGNTDKPAGRATENKGFNNQPYEIRAIPGNDKSPEEDEIYGGPGILGTGGPDIIIRGGTLSVTRSAKDVSRLTKMFLDTSNGARGIQYIAKENLLSRTSVKTEASTGLGYAGGFAKQGVYNPLSTIGQAGANAFGGHLNHLGLDPSSPIIGTDNGGLFPGAGLQRYEDVIKLNNSSEGKGGFFDKNRLVKLWRQIPFYDESGRFLTLDLPSTDYIDRYPGGPGSDLGIGFTTINYADQRTGINNVKETNYKNWFYGKEQVFMANPEYKIDYENVLFDDKNSLIGKYNENSISGLEISLPSESKDIQLISTSVFTKNKDTVNRNKGIYQLNTRELGDRSLNSSIIESGIVDSSKLNPSDFRKDLISFEQAQANNTSTVLSLSPAYNGPESKNIHQRVNLGDPGNPNGKNVWNYSVRTDVKDALDKITASEINTIRYNSELNDLAQFRIAVLDNDGGASQYMHFRAFIDNFSDAYTSNWNPVNYVGRGDTLYNYGNFGRTINMGFTVAAQSKPELIPMYNKLNYLASTLAPDYSESGFMRGNIIRLTMGSYIREQHGFLSSLNYDIPENSPWEIAIDSKGDGGPNREDAGQTAELPHVIKVTMTFTPIHNFLPQKAKNPNNPTQNFIKQQ